MSLEELIQISFNLLWLPRSISARREFCTNLCIVALGLRAGYLVDSFAPADGVKDLQRLLETLRRASSRFDDVQLVYTAEHEQYFFLNMPLLRERADLLSSSSNDGRPTTFILLDQTETIVEPPPEVIETIKLIAASSESPIKLPEGITAQTLVPLSGLLLEFPVSYVPRSDSGTFLCGVALDVYEATIVPEENCGKTNDTRDHTLLKFSSPSHLGRTYDTFVPDSIVEDLDALFRNRLKSVSCSWTLRFNHTVITQDRVAL